MEDDAPTVRAPDLSEDPEDARKGDEIEIDDGDDVEDGEDDLDDGVLDDSKGVAG